MAKTKNKYRWADGKKHSIPEATHRRNVANAKANKDPLYNPTQTLSGVKLRDAAKSLVSLEYDPQETALRQQSLNTTTQGNALIGNADNYYATLRGGDQGRADRMAALYKLTTDDLAKNATAAGSVAATAGTNAQASLQQAAAPGYAPDATASRAAIEADAAQKRVTAANQLYADSAAATNQNYGTLAELANKARDVGGAETRTRLANQLANEQSTIRASQTQLGTQRGAAEAKTVQDLRQSQFNNIVTSQGLGLKTADLQADIANQKATQKEKAAARRQSARDKAAARAVTVRGQDLSASERAADRATRERIAKSKKAAKAAPKQQSAAAQKVVTGIENIVTDIRGNDRLRRAAAQGRWADIAHFLTANGAPPLNAQAGAELAKYGYIRPGTLSQLKRTGIQIPQGWAKSGAQAYNGPH